MAVTDYGKSRWIICAVGALFIIGRIVLRDSTLIVFIVATINSIAYLYVTFSVIERCYISFKDKIRVSDLLNIVKTRRCKKAYIIRAIVFLLNITIVIIYVIFFRSSMINDVIAIFTVVLSIVDDSIIQLVTENYQTY